MNHFTASWILQVILIGNLAYEIICPIKDPLCLINQEIKKTKNKNKNNSPDNW